MQRRGAVAVDQVDVRAVIEQRVDDVSARGGLLLVVLGAVDEALEGDGEGGPGVISSRSPRAFFLPQRCAWSSRSESCSWPSADPPDGLARGDRGGGRTSADCAARCTA